MTDETIHDVIVIGSGPAGYTAAIYTARAELKPLVFEGTSFGGPMMPSRKPGKFSTSVVVIRAPPNCVPSKTSGRSCARAA